MYTPTTHVGKETKHTRGDINHEYHKESYQVRTYVRTYLVRESIEFGQGWGRFSALVFSYVSIIHFRRSSLDQIFPKTP